MDLKCNGYSNDNDLYIDDNVPPDYIRNIKNKEGALVPTILAPVVSPPYYPIIMFVKNLGSVNSNITVYIGKLPCTKPIHFTQETFLNETRLGIGVGSNYGDMEDPEVYNNFLLDQSYFKTLLEYSDKHPDVKLLKCDLQTINISSIYLKAQDIYIVVDGVLGIADNYFLYKDVSQCPGNTGICNGHGNCFLGICMCDNFTLSGPLCNLKRDTSITSSTPTLNPTLPEIIYYNSNSSWSIKFTGLSIAKKSLQDSRSMIYNDFLDFEFQNWIVTNSTTTPSTYDNSNHDKLQKYQLVTKDITITIQVILIGKEREIEFFPGQFESLKYGIGDLRLSITLSDLTDYLKDKYCFKMSFEIETIIEPSPICGSLNDIDYFQFEYGRGYDREDIRWVSSCSNFSTLYCRFYGKCISDELPQSCIVDLEEDPESQNNGDASLFIYFEPFHYNVTIHPDFKILTYIEFPNITQQYCKEFIPRTNITDWLIPTIIPIASFGFICLIFVIINLLKVNRTSFSEFDTNSFINTIGNKAKNNDINNYSHNKNKNNKINNNNNNNNNNNKNNNNNNNNSNNNNNNSDKFSFDEIHQILSGYTNDGVGDNHDIHNDNILIWET
ncbi:hypothetical protein ACTFIV_010889 [Dictyostelium citrinum]